MRIFISCNNVLIFWVLFSLLFSVSTIAADKVTVTFTQPKEVKLEAGKSQTITVKGTSLKQVKGVLLSSDKAGQKVVKGLTGRFSGSDKGGRVYLRLAGGVKPGKYFVQLSDGRKPLVLLPVSASVIEASDSNKTSAKISVTSSQPRSIKLQAGKRQTITIKGTALKQVKGALLSSDKAGKQTVKGLSGKYAGNDSGGRVTLTLGKGVKPGNYYVQLTDGKKPLIQMPVKASVIASATKKKSTTTSKSETSKKTSTASGKDKPPVVKKLLIVGKIEPGKDFRIQAQTEDDNGVEKVEISYLKDKVVAKTRGKKRETIRQKLTAPKSGNPEIVVVAIDNKGQRSESKTITLDLDKAIGKLNAEDKKKLKQEAKKVEALEKSKKRAERLTKKGTESAPSGSGTSKAATKGPLQTAVPVFPDDNGLIINADTAFRWQGVAGADGYTICIKNNASDSGCAVNTYPAIDGSTAGAGQEASWSLGSYYSVVAGTDKFWTVKAFRTADGTQTESTPRAVKFAAAPSAGSAGTSAAFALPMDDIIAGLFEGLLKAPGETAFVQGPNTKFKWQPVVGAEQYVICFSNTATGPLCNVQDVIPENDGSSGFERTWSPGSSFFPALQGTKKYWTVKVCNEDGCYAPPSRVVGFGLPAPIPTSPGSATTPASTSRTPNVRWQSVTNAQKYRVTFHGGGQVNNYDTTSNTTNFTPPTLPPQMGNPVRWSVRACVDLGIDQFNNQVQQADGSFEMVGDGQSDLTCGLPSTAYKINLSAPSTGQGGIGNFSQSQPSSNTIIDVGQEFSWSSATNATNYKFCINKWRDPSLSPLPGCEILRNIETGSSYTMDVNTFNNLVQNFTTNTNQIVQGPGLGNYVFNWKVLACDDLGVCGTPTGERRFLIAANATQVELVAPTLLAPAADATVSETSALSLNWSSVSGADHYTVYIAVNFGSGSVFVRPDLGTFGTPGAGDTGIQTTNTTMTVPASMVATMDGRRPSWFVQACGTANESNCLSNGWQHFFIGDEAVGGGGTTGTDTSFTTLLADTFQDPRCTNCHGGKPTSHNSGTTCTNCHTQAEAYLPGNLEVHWHMAPSSMGFVGKSASQLCNLAIVAPTSASSAACGSSDNAERVRCHLKRDPLVLWAVDSGVVPFGTAAGKATPSSQAAWKSNVDAWIDGGMNCP